MSGLPEAAFNGEVGTAGITVEDPDGDLDLVGLHEFTVDEPDCVGAERIFTGWLYGRTITRGNYRTGPGRVWVCDIVDQNFAWGLKVFRASSAKRPAESDNVRMRFMLESAPMAATPVHDNGLFNTTDNPINFGPSDYISQYPVELAASVAGTSGKNFYAYWDDTANEISGYYDLVTAVNRTATIAISNVIADSTATTFYPTLDAEMRRNPENVNSGVLLGYNGGYVYRQRAETITDFIDRDRVYRTDRIGVEATAINVADSMLIAMSVEQDTISCTILVPSDKVNHARAGMWMDVRFTHLPGLETTTQVPIIRRNVTPVAGRKDRYFLQLELSTKAPDRGPGGGPGTVVVHRPSCSGDVEVTQNSFADPPAETQAFGWTAVAGRTILVVFYNRDNGALSAPPTGFTELEAYGGGLANDGIGVYGKVAAGGETSADFSPAGGSPPVASYAQFLEVSGVGISGAVSAAAKNGDPGVDNGVMSAGSITPAAGLPGIIFGIGNEISDGDINWIDAPTAPWASLVDSDGPGEHPRPYIIAQTVASTSGSYTPEITYTDGNPFGHLWTFIALGLTCVGGSGLPPATGQWVEGEVVTMAGADGTTAYPFANGSLRVYVDDLDQTDAVATYDYEAGTFTLGFIPETGEVVTVDYQGI